MINEEINISFPETDSSHEILQTITDCSFLGSEKFSEENSPRSYSKIDKENTNIKLSKTVSSQENRTKTACSFVSSENFPKTYSKANKEINNINLKSSQKSSLKDNFTFKYLLKNFSLIKRPNIFWGISHHSNVIICARWSEDYTCRKIVVIENSLVVRVSLCLLFFFSIN